MRKMSLYSEILFITYLFCLHLFVDGRILLPDAEPKPFQPLCSRMCHSSADFRGNVRFPYKCSCSQSCAVFGDCCYDSPYKYKVRPTNLDFVCIPVDGVGDFQAVSSCPPNWHGDSCRECVGHLPPVTSRVTNITYSNAFCASCNEDGDDLIRWNVKLRSYEDPVYIQGKTFRNSHCAECNYKDLRHVQCIDPFLKTLLEFGKLTEDKLRSCMGPFLYKCSFGSSRGTFIRMRGSPYSSSSIFGDILVQECLPPAGRLCCDGERYDENTGRCRVPIIDERSPYCGSQATCGPSTYDAI